MRVLLDECVPRGLRKELSGHEVKIVGEAGWAGVKNGALLELAAKEFDVLLTVDRNLEYQQNFSDVALAVVVVHAPSNDIVVLRPWCLRYLRRYPKLGLESWRMSTANKALHTDAANSAAPVSLSLSRQEKLGVSCRVRVSVG